MSFKGYLRPSILWHLMEEGTASQFALERLIGCSRDSVHRQLFAMYHAGLVTLVANPEGYALTLAGIEAALLVEPSQVESA